MRYQMKTKLSRHKLHIIKKMVTNYDFDNLTVAPNLLDPLNFYTIRFYRKRHIVFDIDFKDTTDYCLTCITNQLKKYFKVDFII